MSVAVSTTEVVFVREVIIYGNTMDWYFCSFCYR